MAATINFSDLFSELKTGVKDLALTTLKKYAKEATKDGHEFLNKVKSDLERWTKMLASGDLKTDEFEWLLNSQKASLKMAALEQSGLALIRADQFKSSLLNLIADVVLGRIK